MYYLLFTLYLGIGFYLISRSTFIKDSGLGIKLVFVLFLLKIFAGLFIGWMSQRFYDHNDYWVLNAEGYQEYNILITDPKEFFINIFRSPYGNHYDGFFSSVGSYWNDLRNNIIIKIIAFCDILTRGNYYLNSLFFNFLGFFGHVALFRIFADVYKNKKWLVVAGCFLLPSTLYFSSGIHKDAVVFTMLGLFCYAFYFSLKYNKFTLRRITLIVISLIVLFFIRNFVVIVLIPASLTWYISQRFRWGALKCFAALYLSVITIILSVTLIFPDVKPLTLVTQKQKDFLDMDIAVTQIPTDTLQPNIGSFIKNAPQALDHVFLRPYLWEYPHKFLMVLAVELSGYLVLFLLMLISYKKRTEPYSPFIVFSIVFSVSLLLFTGYIVPNVGSIVRYRSIYLPFIITPLLCSIHWSGFKRKRYIKNNNI